MSDEKSAQWEVYKTGSTHNSVVYVIRPFCRITIDCRENFGDAVLLANEIVAAHGHGPDSVQCDSICALIPNMEAAIKAAKG